MVDIKPQSTLNYKQLWAVGSGSSGLLLNGSLDDLHIFQQVETEKRLGKEEIIQMEIDGMMGFYLTSKGEVYKYGECEYDEKNKVLFIFQFQKNHIIYGVGSNKFGELGLGNNKRMVTEAEVIPFTLQKEENTDYLEVQDIKCAFRQSFIITKQKSKEEKLGYQFSMFCTGQNKNFELGGFKGENVLYNFKENQTVLEQVGSIVKFICGYKFACILNSTKQLYGWGDNKYGQLSGEEATYEKVICITEDVQDVSSGWNHLLILKDNNKLFTLGRGDMGQIGDGSLQNTKTLNQIKGIEGEIQIIECGSEANYVKSSEGIYIWGWNEHGNLGNGNLKNVIQPERLEFNEFKSINQIKSGGAVCYLIENSLSK